MLYADYTAPDGNFYRIDVSVNPLVHACPTFGKEYIVRLDDTDPSWCDDCLNEEARGGGRREEKA